MARNEAISSQDNQYHNALFSGDSHAVIAARYDVFVGRGQNIRCCITAIKSALNFSLTGICLPAIWI